MIYDRIRSMKDETNKASNIINTSNSFLVSI
jgi:hypothetical protein